MATRRENRMITSIIFDACYTLCDLDHRNVYEDVEDALKFLKSKGVKLFVISNWDDVSFDAYAKHLRPYFDQVIFTDSHKEHATAQLVAGSMPSEWATVG